MNLATVTALISEISVFFGIIIPVVACVKKVANGAKCQLRSEMLRIFYMNRDDGVIHQYEYENFIMLYEAYKALKGNSFIDKIYKEVQNWKIIS